MKLAGNVTAREALQIAIADPKRAARRVRFEIQKIVQPFAIANLRRKYGLRIRNTVLFDRPLDVSAAGLTVKIVPKGAIANGLCSGGEFEPAELKFVSRILTSDSVFLDVGANVGIFSLLASKIAISGKIIAFEPATETFELLCRNVELNEARNAVAYRVALSNSAGEAKLNLNAPGKDGLNTLGRPSHPSCEPVGTETVPTTTIDEFLRAQSLTHVDAMKVDVEGAELFVLQGAENLLRQPNAPLILYESFLFLTKGFDYHPVEIFWFLDRCGFECFTLDSETGKLAQPGASRAYDSMIVAVKPSHTKYSMIKELAR